MPVASVAASTSEVPLRTTVYLTLPMLFLPISKPASCHGPQTKPGNKAKG